MFFKKANETKPNPAAAATPPVSAPAAPAVKTGGLAHAGAVPLAADEAKRRAAVAKHFAAAFGETVALMMHAPEYKALTLADLEWLVAPAITTGQFSVSTAQSRTSGSMAPVGVVLWASVSETVDKRLRETRGVPLKLAPAEWKSGDILWVIACVGDQRILQGMLNHLQNNEWVQRPVKALTRGPDGKTAVTILGIKAA